eukprot:6187808-Pleurochrysis_carterae.AAC.1
MQARSKRRRPPSTDNDGDQRETRGGGTALALGSNGGGDVLPQPFFTRGDGTFVADAALHREARRKAADALAAKLRTNGNVVPEGLIVLRGGVSRNSLGWLVTRMLACSISSGVHPGQYKKKRPGAESSARSAISDESPVVSTTT